MEQHQLDWLHLPTELWLRVCDHLDVKSVVTLATTCKTLHSLLQRKSLWNSLFTRYYPFKPHLDWTRMYQPSDFTFEPKSIRSRFQSIYSSGDSHSSETKEVQVFEVHISKGGTIMGSFASFAEACQHINESGSELPPRIIVHPGVYELRDGDLECQQVPEIFGIWPIESRMPDARIKLVGDEFDIKARFANIRFIGRKSDDTEIVSGYIAFEDCHFTTPFLIKGEMFVHL